MIMLLGRFLSKLNRIQTNQTVIVGIDGASASGKSTLAAKLRELDDRVTVVHMDDFYRPSKERKSVNPKVIGANFDWERTRDQVLTPLIHNHFGRYQRYDWDTDKMAEWHNVSSGGIVIIEGCFSTRSELLSFYDVRIWVDCPKHICRERVILREQEGSDNRYLWENIYRPAEEKYIEVQRPGEYADIIIDGASKAGNLINCEMDVGFESDRWLNL